MYLILCHAIISRDLLIGASLNTGRDLSSDHMPIEIYINHPPSICNIKYRPRWKFEKVDWQSWRRGLRQIKFENQSSINESNKHITGSLLNSTYIIQKSSGKIQSKIFKAMVGCRMFAVDANKM